jgi:hypothetical protein
MMEKTPNRPLTTRISEQSPTEPDIFEIWAVRRRCDGKDPQYANYNDNEFTVPSQSPTYFENMGR